MKETIAFLVFIPPAIILIVIVSSIAYSIWYRRNYKTKYQNTEHDKDWDKCWDCKKAEPTMYFDYNLFGRIYRCSKCSNVKL
jgi:hypothetical protein